MRRTILLAAVLVGISSVKAYSAGVLKIPVDDNLGFIPQVFNEPDGTKVLWTEFFASNASSVAVGRSTIDGGELPASTLDYTDCFFIVRGTATLTVEGKSYSVHAGDFILLPRGARLEGMNFHNYVHIAASFETQPGAKSNGPLEMRRLRPDLLKDKNFTVGGTNMRHVYYQGTGGVVVRVWQSTQPDMTTDFFTSPWSELSFITAGTGTITKVDGSTESIKAGDSIFIAKGQRLKLSTHKLRKLAIVFDQSAPATAAE